MKRFIKFGFLITLIFLFIGVLAACGEGHTPSDTGNGGNSQSSAPSSSSDNPSVLSSPENVYLNIEVTGGGTEYLLTWNEVEKATAYRVEFGGEIIETAYNEVYLTDSVTVNTEYTFYVTALGDGDSIKSSEPTVKEQKIETVTKGLNYTLNEKGGYEVTKGNADITGRVVIPDKYNGIAITSLGYEAFSYGLGPLAPNYNMDTESVRIPNGVSIISEMAFAYCYVLNEAILPAALKSVGDHAFVSCENIGEFSIPQGVEHIGIAAFGTCKSITEIVLPDSVTYIGNEAFKFCENLRRVVVLSNPEYVGMDAFHETEWYDNQPDGWITFGKVLYGYKGELPENTFLTELPAGIEVIAGGVFKSQKNLIGITLSESITEIGDGAFAVCSSLKTVNLPNSIKRIPHGAFACCSQLEEITLPDSITSIGECAFMSCTSLKTVNLPKGLTSIEQEAFLECTSLESIIMPDSVAHVGLAAFEQCRALNTVKLSAGLKVIESAFSYCAIEEIFIPKNMETIMTQSFFCCKNLKKVVFEEGSQMKMIMNQAFYGCINLVEINIPKGAELQGNPFEGCENLVL